MNKVLNKIIVLMLILCVLSTTVSMAEGEETTKEEENLNAVAEEVIEDNQEEPEKVEASLNKTEATIVVTKTVSLKLNNTEEVPTWTSSNKKIATVTSNGEVKAIKAGTVKITATLNDGSKYVCTVKVEDPKLNATSKSLVKGATFKLKFSDTTLSATWASENAVVAEVSTSGVVTAKKKGDVIIKGTVGGKKYTCKIKVEEPKINAKSKTIVKGKKYTLKISGTKKKVTWKSKSKSIATVSSKGVVTAKKAGTVNIVASIDGIEYTCKVKVVNKGLAKKSLVMTKGNTYKMVVYDISGTKKWSTTNKKVATVDSKGKITAKGKGTATIKMKNKSKTYKCTVKVEAPSISVSQKEIVVGTQSTVKVSGTSKSYKYSISDSNVASISKDGVVTGVQVGIAKVTVSLDGRKYTQTIKVTDPSSYTGWAESAGITMFLKNGVPVTGWTDILNEKYYFDEMGNPVSGWQTIDGQKYYFERTGKLMVSGWKIIGKKKYYFNKNGVYLTGWQVVNKKKYKFKSDGQLISRMGIDVSEYQGNIDWDKVKAAGVDFAILRIGWTGNKNNHTIDKKFERNYAECKRVGIEVGAYVFCYSNTEKTAKDAAKWTLKQIEGKTFEYPIYLDIEPNSDLNGLSKTKLTNVCLAFNKAIEKDGRKAGIYSCKAWLNKKLDMEKLSSYETWVAHYTSDWKSPKKGIVTDYAGRWKVWQYTSFGSVSGISGRVDMNVDISRY